LNQEKYFELSVNLNLFLLKNHKLNLQLLIYYFVGDLKNLINRNYVNNIFGLIFGFVKGFFFIFLSTSGIIYLFYTTKDFPLFLKNSLFFEPIKTYSIKVIEKIVNFI